MGVTWELKGIPSWSMRRRPRIENRIRRGREEHGYLQRDLALLLGHENPSQVSRYERGLVMPDCENMLKLCYIFNTLPEFLYPELTRAWKEEVRQRKEKMQKVEEEKTEHGP